MNLRAALRKCPYYAVLLMPLALAAAGPVVVELALVRGKPEGGVRTVRVERDDALEIKARSDEPLEIHIHGYDVTLRVQPGAVASVRMGAKLVGRFPVTAHLHGKEGGKASEPTLLYLEVHPR
jgi:hypothetical protein